MRINKFALIPFLIFLSFGIPSVAQDLIIRTNGARIEAKILNSDSLFVSYYNLVDSAKTVYNLSTEYINQLVYENGSTVDFSNQSDLVSQIAAPFKRNILQSNLFSLVCFGNINIRYERITGTGNIGLFTEAAFTIKPELYRYEKNEDYKLIEAWGSSISRSVFFVEAGMIYYPSQKGIFRYGTGFSTLINIYKVDIYEDYNYISSGTGYALFGTVMFNNMVRIFFSESLQLYVAFDLGIIPRFLENYVFSLSISHSF